MKSAVMNVGVGSANNGNNVRKDLYALLTLYQKEFLLHISNSY